MSLPQRFGAASCFCGEHGLRGMAFRGASSARKLQQHLQPHHKSLQDLCPAGRLGALLDATSTERGFTGVWKKEKELCDPMDGAFAAVSLPWLYRRAVGFLNFLEVENTEEFFRTTLKAGGIMDVVESYPWSGEIVSHKRRDKRPGYHTGRVTSTRDGPQLQIEWQEPYGGKGTDTFILSNNGSTLTQVSLMEFADVNKNCSYRTIYNRVHSRGQ